jgi:hypothetical protein
LRTDGEKGEYLQGKVNDSSEGKGGLLSETCQYQQKIIRPKNAIFSIFTYCPYTMVVTKIIRLIQGKPLSSPALNTSQEIYLKSKIQFGVAIIAIGIFCPVFWISLLMGAPKEELMMSTCSSLALVLFGIMYIIFYRHQWKKESRKKPT